MIWINGEKFDQSTARVQESFGTFAVFIGPTKNGLPLEAFPMRQLAEKFAQELRLVPNGEEVIFSAGRFIHRKVQVRSSQD